jgi:hypothetical protein
MQASALVELYAGAPARAVELIDQRVPAIRRAFLFRIQAVRVFTAFVRMAARLGALAAGTRDPARLETAIVRECDELYGGPDASTRSSSVLVRAQLAVLHGDLDAATAGYRSAAAAFDALDMSLIASAARWRLGELVGGDEGRTLIDQVGAALTAEGIVRPDRVVAMFAPVPAEARGMHPRRRARR